MYNSQADESFTALNANQLTRRVALVVQWTGALATDTSKYFCHGFESCGRHILSLGPRILNSPPKNGGVVALFRIVFCSIHDNSATQKDIVMVLVSFES